MKIWLDDLRTAPVGYIHVYSVNDAIELIKNVPSSIIEEINCDHDLGDYSQFGGDGIKLLDYLLGVGLLVPIVLHTMNPVGRENMQRILDRYWP
jgi:hypothetical protein